MDDYGLTLLGFSARTYPILVEIAADAAGSRAENMRVQVVLNLPLEEEGRSFDKPHGWFEPNFCSLENWQHHNLKGVIMPGVMHMPAVSEVWKSVKRVKPDFTRERLSIVIHPSAEVASSAEIGPGTWVHPNVSVSSMSKVGFCCHLNRNSSLGHHNVLGDFSRLNPGAHTAGFCSVGARTTVGIGAVCIEKVRIGSDCMIGAGAVVVSDGLDGHLALGVPAQWHPKKP